MNKTNVLFLVLMSAVTIAANGAAATCNQTDTAPVQAAPCQQCPCQYIAAIKKAIKERDADAAKAHWITDCCIESERARAQHTSDLNAAVSDALEKARNAGVDVSEFETCSNQRSIPFMPPYITKKLKDHYMRAQ